MDRSRNKQQRSRRECDDDGECDVVCENSSHCTRSEDAHHRYRHDLVRTVAVAAAVGVQSSSILAAD